MSRTQLLRCDVEPTSGGLEKPVANGVVTEFEADMAKKVNRTSGPIVLEASSGTSRDSTRRLGVAWFVTKPIYLKRKLQDILIFSRCT
jgi:hypothetical protein